MALINLAKDPETFSRLNLHLVAGSPRPETLGWHRYCLCIPFEQSAFGTEKPMDV